MNTNKYLNKHKISIFDQAEEEADKVRDLNSLANPFKTC
jgi:hypothetical protein